MLVAWAEGRPIQVRHRTDPWITVHTEHCQCLDFSSGGDVSKFKIEWRVKPDLPWYRVGFLKLGNLTFTSTVGTEEQEQTMEIGTSFVRWLTERISYEV